MYSFICTSCKYSCSTKHFSLSVAQEASGLATIQPHDSRGSKPLEKSKGSTKGKPIYFLYTSISTRLLTYFTCAERNLGSLSGLKLLHLLLFIFCSPNITFNFSTKAYYSNDLDMLHPCRVRVEETSSGSFILWLVLLSPQVHMLLLLFNRLRLLTWGYLPVLLEHPLHFPQPTSTYPPMSVVDGCSFPVKGH